MCPSDLIYCRRLHYQFNKSRCTESESAQNTMEKDRNWNFDPIYFLIVHSGQRKFNVSPTHNKTDLYI